MKIDQIELALNAKPDNLLVFLGLEEDGHPGLADISGTAYVESDAPLCEDSRVVGTYPAFRRWQIRCFGERN